MYVSMMTYIDLSLMGLNILERVSKLITTIRYIHVGL